jgi:hypothetical protein
LTCSLHLCLTAGLSFRFVQKDPIVCDAPAELGAMEVSALASAWGDRLQSLTFNGPPLTGTFFPAVVQHFPALQSLTLVNTPAAQEGDMSARITAFCSRLTRPLRLALPPDLLK